MICFIPFGFVCIYLFSCTINSIMFERCCNMRVVCAFYFSIFVAASFDMNEGFHYDYCYVCPKSQANHNELQLLLLCHVKMGALNVFDMFMSNKHIILEFYEIVLSKNSVQHIRDNYAYWFQFRWTFFFVDQAIKHRYKMRGIDFLARIHKHTHVYVKTFIEYTRVKKKKKFVCRTLVRCCIVNEKTHFKQNKTTNEIVSIKELKTALENQKREEKQITLVKLLNA